MGSAKDMTKFTASLETLSFSLYNIKSQDRPLDEGPYEGRTVSASSGYTSSWAHKTDYDWDKIGVENCDVDLNDKDFKCKDDTEHRAGSMRRAFKDLLDKVTGLEMELSMGKLVETISQEELELYLLNATNGYTLRERTQTRDLLKISDCTSTCFPVAEVPRTLWMRVNTVLGVDTRSRKNIACYEKRYFRKHRRNFIPYKVPLALPQTQHSTLICNRMRPPPTAIMASQTTSDSLCARVLEVAGRTCRAGMDSSLCARLRKSFPTLSLCY